MKSYPHNLNLRAVCAAIDAFEAQQDDVPESGMIAAFEKLLAASGIVQRAEAAEAKLAELEKQEPYAFGSKWTDMNTEGRHFSGSIFNNAWGEYTKPLFTRPAPAINLAELVPVITRLKRRYVCNEGSEYEFIACVTPERSSIGTGQVWDDWRELSAILRKIKEQPE